MYKKLNKMLEYVPHNYSEYPFIVIRDSAVILFCLRENTLSNMVSLAFRMKGEKMCHLPSFMASFPYLLHFVVINK